MKLHRAMFLAVAFASATAAAAPDKQAPADKQAPSERRDKQAPADNQAPSERRDKQAPADKQAPSEKQAPTDKQAPAEVTPAEAKRWMALFTKVVDTVVDNRSHCTKMAGELNAVVDANQATIEMARDAKAKGKRLPEHVRQEMADGARRMLGALDKCGRDEKVGAAFKRIDLGGRRS